MPLLQFSFYYTSIGMQRHRSKSKSVHKKKSKSRSKSKKKKNDKDQASKEKSDDKEKPDTKNKKNNKKNKTESKDKEKESKTEETQPKEALPPPPPQPVVPDPTALDSAPSFMFGHTSYILKWFTEEDIPEDKFMFIATRDKSSTQTKNEFDKDYVVGYCKDVERFKRVVTVGEKLMGPQQFEVKINILMQLELSDTNNRDEKWENLENRFINFIIEALVLSFQTNLKRMHTDSFIDLRNSELDVESIESLLKSRVKVFSQNPVRNITFNNIILQRSIYYLDN